METSLTMKKIYMDIQEKLYYMIPEKWDSIFLYASIFEGIQNLETGEMFFYYFPKGILRKEPVNVYEIPNKFNIEEDEYLKLTDELYEKIKKLKEEFVRVNKKNWTNITISIQNYRFMVEYDYEDLKTCEFNSYERHIIWRYNNLGIREEQLSKEEHKIIERYLLGEKVVKRRERYETGIYIKNIKNIVDYDTESYDSEQNIEYVATKNEKARNQIIMPGDQLQADKKSLLKKI